MLTFLLILISYADDYTLIIFLMNFEKTSQETSYLSEGGEASLEWFSRNGMQVNLTKFQLVMNDCRRSRLEPEHTFIL